MNKYLLFSILFFLSTLLLSAQSTDNKLILPMLTLKDKSVEASLGDVSTYISKKPKGLRFPISKVKFIQVSDSLTYEIEGIDNSWTNLFNYGEASYGYTIVNNRLFLIVGLANQDIDLNPIFARMQDTKSFSKDKKPSSGVDKNPKWFYSYVNGESTQVKVLDLDILDK